MVIQKLDITKEHCPMTFVKTKIELSKLNKGDVLHVLVADNESLTNIPRASVEQGYDVISVSESEIQGISVIAIRK